MIRPSVCEFMILLLLILQLVIKYQKNFIENQNRPTNSVNENNNVDKVLLLRVISKP